MSKKGLLGPLRSPQVIAIALGFVLANVVHFVAGDLVHGLLDSLLNKMNMRGSDGSFSLNLGSLVATLLGGALAIAGILAFARWAGEEKSEG